MFSTLQAESLQQYGQECRSSGNQGLTELSAAVRWHRGLVYLVGIALYYATVAMPHCSADSMLGLLAEKNSH